MKTNLITREGYNRLKTELDFLWREERPEVTKKSLGQQAWATEVKMQITSTIKTPA